MVQGALSLQQVRADTAIPAEATCLRARYLECVHWLRGAVLPPFASYIADAPVVCPPLADNMDELAGLRGSRGTHVIRQYEYAP